MTDSDYTAKVNEAADKEYYCSQGVPGYDFEKRRDAFLAGIAWSRLNVPPEVTAMRDALREVLDLVETLSSNYELVVVNNAWERLEAFDARIAGLNGNL